MALFDLPLDELRDHRSASAEPADFDAFWSATLLEARAHDLDARFEPVDTGLTGVRVYDVTFAGFGGHPVKAWLTVPAGAGEPLPLVVEVHGGPTAHDTDAFRAYAATWVDEGFAVVQVNYRGSTGYGSAWRDALEARVGHVELADVATMLHRLAGTAEMFGDVALGIEARLLETGLEQWGAAERADRICSAVAAIQQAA